MANSSLMCLLFCVNIVSLLIMMLIDIADKMVEDMKKRIPEYSKCFNQSRENYSELDSSLGSPKLEISLYDDFEPSYLARPNLNDVISLHSLE